ncbi:hypothetical protein BDV93DRAFT_601466 [Ceratobasidium sp. AG-I]|nr:hypothetical protein BDV93DRAFT_601466 [Ceratobasidium sp. AG-I]
MDNAPELSASIQERIPSESGRYNDTHAGYAKKRTLAVGPFSGLGGDEDAFHPYGPVPDGWMEIVHPVEGLPFFYNAESKVITEAYIRIAHVLAQVEHWKTQITRVIEALDNETTRLSSMDIFIDPTEDRRSGQRSCSYYLVDHSSCSIAFLRQVDTASVGLPDVRSIIHLERVLQGEYWTHCEFMPRPDVNMTQSVKKLQGQLAALMIDNISSEGSTSPFTSKECKNYIKGLEEAKEDQYRNWSAARINSLLIQSQIVNLHGESCARLDRTAVVTGQHASVRSESYLQFSKLMFDCPVIHLTKLEHVWIERIIYTHHWRKLVTDLIQEWTGALAFTAVVWVSNAILFSTASSPIVILLLGASTASVFCGGAKGLLLIRTHRAMGKYAAHGSQFLQSKETYATGLQDLSFEYSYPWACALWAACFTSLAVIWIMVTELVECLFSLLFQFGYIPVYVIVTIALVFGAWIYGQRTNPTRFSFSSQDVRIRCS